MSMCGSGQTQFQPSSPPSWSPPPLFVAGNAPPRRVEQEGGFASHHQYVSGGGTQVSLQEGDIRQDLVVRDTTEEDSDQGGHHSSSSSMDSGSSNSMGKNNNRSSKATRSMSGCNTRNNRRVAVGRNSNKCGITTERTVVEHKYHDHYHDSLSVVCASSSRTGSYGSNKYMIAKRPPGSARGGVTMAFPERLHEMLTTVEEEGLSHVISWQPHGRCFLIHKKNIFVEQVMPRFFHQTKLTSFQRQLNLYGFVRLTAGRDRGGYYHECFLRGRADFCRCMVRTRVKGNGMKAASSPDTEPNFYLMEPCYDQPRADEARSTTPTGNMIEEDSTTTSASNDNTATASMLMEEVGSLDLDEMSNVKTMVKAHSDEDMMDHDMEEEEAECSPIIAPTSSSSMDIPMDLGPAISLPSSAALVSPPESPNTRSRSPLMLSSTFMPLLPSLPHSGDAVFFEGLKFRYLDHLDAFDFNAHDDDDDIHGDDISHGEIASV